MTETQKNALLSEIHKLHYRNELSQTVTADYFEPGMMEYLDKSEGIYDENTGNILLRYESKGVRYEGRTELIEKIKTGDEIQVVRDRENLYNSNNFTMLTQNGKNVGNMPMDLCNAIAPLFDNGELIFIHAEVSFVEPISVRNRHAKQAMLFIELSCRLLI